MVAGRETDRSGAGRPRRRRRYYRVGAMAQRRCNRGKLEARAGCRRSCRDDCAKECRAVRRYLQWTALQPVDQAAAMLAGGTGGAQRDRRKPLDQPRHAKDGNGTWNRRRRQRGAVEPGGLDSERYSNRGDPARPRRRRSDHRVGEMARRGCRRRRLEARAVNRSIRQPGRSTIRPAKRILDSGRPRSLCNKQAILPVLLRGSDSPVPPWEWRGEKHERRLPARQGS